MVLVVLDAAVLLQARWPCDEVWVVIASPATQVSRLLKREPFRQQADVERRILSQPTHEENVGYADVVVSTDWAWAFEGAPRAKVEEVPADGSESASALQGAASVEQQSTDLTARIVHKAVAALWPRVTKTRPIGHRDKNQQL